MPGQGVWGGLREGQGSGKPGPGPTTPACPPSRRGQKPQTVHTEMCSEARGPGWEGSGRPDKALRAGGLVLGRSQVHWPPSSPCRLDAPRSTCPRPLPTAWLPPSPGPALLCESHPGA